MQSMDHADKQYQSANLDKNVILERLRRHGCRITRQREALLEVILAGNCSCCKEVYYQAAKKEPNIGMATIYRSIVEGGECLWTKGSDAFRGRKRRISNEETQILGMGYDRLFRYDSLYRIQTQIIGG